MMVSTDCDYVRVVCARGVCGVPVHVPSLDV